MQVMKVVGKQDKVEKGAEETGTNEEGTDS